VTEKVKRTQGHREGDSDMNNNNNDHDHVTDDAVRMAQLRLLAQEDQWRAAWSDNTTATPRYGVNVRDVVLRADDLLLKATQVIGVGVGISPLTLQLLKNAITTYDAGQRLDRGEITEAEYDDYVRWLYPGPDQG
jgi:hypothetical protein